MSFARCASSGLGGARTLLCGSSDRRYTVSATSPSVCKALEIGTKGYLIKQDVSSVIPAVQAVMAGQVVMGAEVLNKLRVSPQSTTSDESSSVDRVVSHDDAQAVQGSRNPDSSGPSERFAGLTERELEDRKSTRLNSSH